MDAADLELPLNPADHPINNRFRTAAEAAELYRNTPRFFAIEIPRGSSRHIADGIFLTRCQECDEFALSYGSIPRYASIGIHEAQVHGLEVPGINTPMVF